MQIPMDIFAGTGSVSFYFLNSFCENSFDDFLDTLAVRTVADSLAGVYQVAFLVQLPRKLIYSSPESKYMYKENHEGFLKYSFLPCQSLLSRPPPRVPSVLPQCSPIQVANTE